MTTAVTGIEPALDTISRSIGARAAALDAQRTDVRSDLAALGAAGLFDLGFDGDLTDMVRVIDTVSAHSLAVGFAAWAHRMSLQYVHHCAEVRAEHFGALAGGTRIGVTAMAAALKHVAGLAQLPIIAEPDAGGLSLSGPIHWASNVFPGALVIAPARTVTGATYVVALDADTAGVTVDPAPALMALGATASTSLRLDRVRVSPDRVISTELPEFVARIRPTFLLLQTAFCVGVTRAALDGARDSRDGSATQFQAGLSETRGRAALLREQLYRLAGDPTAASSAELIRLRLDAATTAVDATRLEITLAGGAGYAVGSAANRRFREAAFLPIQSPSEGQLRWELTAYTQYE